MGKTVPNRNLECLNNDIGCALAARFWNYKKAHATRMRLPGQHQPANLLKNRIIPDREFGKLFDFDCGAAKIFDYFSKDQIAALSSERIRRSIIREMNGIQEFALCIQKSAEPHFLIVFCADSLFTDVIAC
jgi:hypothetical protein